MHMTLNLSPVMKIEENLFKGKQNCILFLWM